MASPSCGNIPGQSYASSGHAQRDILRVNKQIDPPGTAIRCDWPQCLRTFTRPADLNRHRNTVHDVTKQSWCTVSGCNRCAGFAGPFTRKDKHMNRVHSVRAADITITHQSMGFVTDAAGYAGTTLATDPLLFQDAGGLSNDPDFAGFTGYNNFARPLASTSVYGPSPPFSTVDTADSADATYLANGSGFVGLPNSEGSGPSWFHDGCGIAGIAGFHELGGADGFAGGIASVGGFGFASAGGLDSANAFMTVDATGVGTFPLDDAFDWSTIDPSLNEFDNADTSTNLNGYFNGAI
ncbi:MAG: hypothetical protein M1840_001506 [Geoglossum simile]|nr:MAG: hypothetical protein M1840_001506 [Geoglossum simile]